MPFVFAHHSLKCLCFCKSLFKMSFVFCKSLFKMSFVFCTSLCIMFFVFCTSFYKMFFCFLQISLSTDFCSKPLVFFCTSRSITYFNNLVQFIWCIDEILSTWQWICDIVVLCCFAQGASFSLCQNFQVIVYSGRYAAWTNKYVHVYHMSCMWHIWRLDKLFVQPKCEVDNLKHGQTVPCINSYIDRPLMSLSIPQNIKTRSAWKRFLNSKSMYYSVCGTSEIWYYTWHLVVILLFLWTSKPLLLPLKQHSIKKIQYS